MLDLKASKICGNLLSVKLDCEGCQQLVQIFVYPEEAIEPHGSGGGRGEGGG